MPQNFTQVRHMVINAAQAGQRVDNFLLRELRDVPKSHVYRLLRSGQVRVNGGRAKPTRRLDEGDTLRLPPIRDLGEKREIRVPDSSRQEILQAILHEDDDLLVLNKPSGWAVHAGSAVPYGIIDALRQGRDDLAYLELAHRLDRETSGCLVLAKHRESLAGLHAGFRGQGDNGHTKHYLALVDGAWKGPGRRVDLPLSSQQLEGGERMVKVDRDAGRKAVSDFEQEEGFTDCSLMRVSIHTGRMHQIRVHAQALGHPVVGDRKYGDRNRNQFFRRYGVRRMFLHAQSISLTYAGKEMQFSAPLPADLETVLENLRA